MIALTINGELRDFAESLKVAQLIDRMGLVGKRIAIERNGEIVPRSEFERVELIDGDSLEIVVAVGGG